MENVSNDMVGEQLQLDLYAVSDTDAIKASVDAQCQGMPVSWINTKTIDIREIYSNSKNFYSCDDIERLAESILQFGLMENLTVMKETSLAGSVKKYKIIAGERRWRALNLLAEQGHLEFLRVTCVVKEKMDEDQEILHLITANQYRKKTFREQAAEIIHVKEAMKGQQSGRIRDTVSQITGISGTKIAQIEAIRNNLIGAFVDALNDGNITFTAAYELSGMPPETQAELYGKYLLGEQLTVAHIKDMKAEMAEEDVDGQMSLEDFEEEQEPAEGEQAAAPEEPAEAEGEEPDLYAEGLDPMDVEIADAWERVKTRIHISSGTTKTGMLERLKKYMGSSWSGFSVHGASIWYINCTPVGIQLEVESTDGRRAGRKQITWKAFADRVIALGLFTPAPELVDAHPQTKESLCYQCDNYENCAQKQANVTTCDSYVDRKEARKTEEQRYSEEQNRIDRETKQKFQEMRDKEQAEAVPAEGAKDQKKDLRTMRVSGQTLMDISTHNTPYMIIRQDKQTPFEEGDRLLMIGMQEGVYTGKSLKVCITCMDDAETSSGIKEGYAVIGISMIGREEKAD